MENVAKPVRIESEEGQMHFLSMSQASAYIAGKTGKTKEHIRAKMKKRRKQIYDYKISYLKCRD